MTSIPLANLGTALYDAGQYDESISAFSDVLEIRMETRGSSHPSVGLSLDQLCTLRTAISQAEAALPQCRRAFEIITTSLPADHPDVAMVKTNLGNALFKSGRRDEGIEMARSAVESWIAANGPDHPNTGRGHRALAHKLAEAGHLDEAQREIAAALGIFERSLGPEHAVVAQTKTSMANMRFMAGDTEDALRMYDENRDQVIATMGEDHPYFAVAEFGRGEALAALGRKDEARAALHAALKIRIDRYGEDSDKVAMIREVLAKL